MAKTVLSIITIAVINACLLNYSSADGTPPSMAKKMALGIVAGGTGAIVGTPAEIALIRMTADGRLPPESRRGYKNVFDALIRITREEGIVTLWRVRMAIV